MKAYCSRCGEKRRDHVDWKLSSIASEIFSEITNLEHSKLWQTFRLLLFKPGQLTRDYWNGWRKRFLGPVKLYLVFFALTLLLYSIHRPTAVYDVRTFAATNSNGQFSRLLEERATKRGVATSQLIQEVNSSLQRYLSMSQLFYPLIVALALKLLLRRHRLYFAEHFIFALHSLTFIYLSFLVAWPLFVLFGIDTSAAKYTPAYLAITFASFVWTAAYLFLALRRAYGESWLPALVKGFLLFVTYMLTSMFFMGLSLALTLTLIGRTG
jgi:hypothetical protein